MLRNDWRYSRDFTAYFFALVPGQVIGRGETQVLCSFGSMFNRTLVSGWTLQHCFDVCEERVAEMRSHDIPHDAFCLSWNKRIDAPSRPFPDARVFTRIQPSKFADQTTRGVITTLSNAGLAFVVPQVWTKVGGHPYA